MNIPIAAKANPAWKFMFPECPNKFATKGTAHGAIAAPKLIPKTKMLNPASRRRSPSEYKSPTMSETFGFNSPVPITISAIEVYRAT